DRRKLAESGGVFVLMTMEPDTGNVVAGPQVILRGIATPELESAVLEKVNELVARLIRENRRAVEQGKYDVEGFTENLRVEVRRVVHSLIGKKPVVIPF